MVVLGCVQVYFDFSSSSPFLWYCQWVATRALQGMQISAQGSSAALLTETGIANVSSCRVKCSLRVVI